MKLTKRKAFNFLRSYFDVLNEIPDDKDKLSFLIAVIDKQFLDENPKDLSFVSKLCYESQRHAIESSVKGWKRVNNTDVMGNPTTDPMTNPTTDPTTNPMTNPMTNPKEEEEEEEEEEEVKGNIPKPSASELIDWNNLLIFFNSTTGKKSKLINNKTKASLKARLKEGYTKLDIKEAIKNCYADPYHKETNHKYLTLEFISRAEKLDRYSQKEIANKDVATTGKFAGFAVGHKDGTRFIDYISDDGQAVWKNKKDML